MKDFVDVTVDTTELVSSPLTSYSTIGLIGIELGAAAKPCKAYEIGGADDLVLYADATGGEAVIPASSQVYKSAMAAFSNGASKLWIVYGVAQQPTYEENATDAQKLAADNAAKFAKLAEAKDIMAMIDVDIVVFAGMTETADTAFVSDSTKGLISFVQLGAAITPRLGYFMLQPGQYPGAEGTPAAITSTGSEYLIGFAHNAINPTGAIADVAAAMAGLTASLKPSESIVAKGISGIAFSGDFTATEMSAIEGAKINAVTTSYNRNGDYFAGTFKTQSTNSAKSEGDTMRVINFVAKTLENSLSTPRIIGTLRINYSGMMSLQETVLAILTNLANTGIIEDAFSIHIPLLSILAKQADARSQMEISTLAAAVSSRTVKVQVAVRYYGVVYKIDVSPLKFTI